MTIDLQNSTDYEVLRAAEVLAHIVAAADEAGFEFLVVGATARSIISIGLLGTPPERKTKDIDIAAEVDSWDEFEILAEKLDGRIGLHKFTVAGMEVDVVAYGGVEREDRTILWPNDHRMNVLGLREAVDSAETVLLPGGVGVRVPSIPALALLKLFAWHDRHFVDTRDAIDLATIIAWYSSGRYFELLYGEEIELLEQYEYDPPLAGAALLGKHMSDLLDQRGVAVLLELVVNEDLMGRLALDMGAVRALALISAMGAGIGDAAAGKSQPQLG